jgi:hypothetical protein
MLRILGSNIVIRNNRGGDTMKQNFKIRLLAAGLLFLLTASLYSCGGGGSSYGGGSYSGAPGGSITAPGMFALSSPSDGAIGVGTAPALTWMPAAGAGDYRVQVDTADTFAGTLVINALISAATYTYPVPAGLLAPGIKYFWRVIAENSYGRAIAGPASFTP